MGRSNELSHKAIQVKKNNISFLYSNYINKM